MSKLRDSKTTSRPTARRNADEATAAAAGLKRVAIVASPEKKTAAATLERTRRWLAGRAEVVFAEQTWDAHRALPQRPELLFVVGGDGTLIAAAHSLRTQQIPIVGINEGKLGFLAEFTIDQLERDGSFLFAQGELPLTRRLMLECRLEQPGHPPFVSLAANDCVIHAGPPYRMIELQVSVDADDVAELRGDGLIVSTATGSTAHNLSAGGPILEPTAEAFLLTPICAHALTFRPLTLDARRRVAVRGPRVNEGTTLVIDGRERRRFTAESLLTITRYGADFLLVRNPTRSKWYALRHKLMWGENPRNRA